MRAVYFIALNTFREIIRDRILYGLFVFAILLIGFSLVLGQLSYAEQMRISSDFGFAAINLSAVIISIFIGSTLVSRELEHRTIYTLLVRPVSRQQFLLGKFFGLSLVNVTALSALSVILAITFYFLGKTWDYDCTMVVIGILLESLVMMSFTILFGTFTKPILAVSYALGLFLIGRWMDTLNFFAEKSFATGFKVFNEVLQRMLPNLAKFNWSTYTLSEQQIPLSQVALAVFYAGGWVALVIVIASIVFRKKDFV